LDFSTADCPNSPSNYRECGSSWYKKIFLCTVAVHWNKKSTVMTDYSARNCQLLEEDSTGGTVIPQGITESLKRNPPEE
jgi:hypothetical protein